MRLFFHRLTHWEYWPFALVYFPVFFLWAYYSLKARSLFFFNAANPSIKNGGFMSESKMAIYDLIPKQYIPKTILINEDAKLADVLQSRQRSNISYPLIAKPDIGLRGAAVKKIDSEADLIDYHQRATFDYLLQDLIPYQNECGIFYIRFPDEKRGRITGIVGKELLTVIGDGKSTISQLLKKDPRHEFQRIPLERELAASINDVLPQGQKRNLVPYGNHARGAKFIDITNRATAQLETTIDEICREIPGFHFGRLDIMFNTFEDLERKENFSIVELNGAGSEPTHIYDPKHSLFFAWKELMRHITIMYQISVANHKKGFSYLQHKEGMEQYRTHLGQSNKIVNF